MVGNRIDDREDRDQTEGDAILILCCILYCKEVVALSGNTWSRLIVSGRRVSFVGCAQREGVSRCCKWAKGSVERTKQRCSRP
jgi:hypothetical protein